MTTTTIPAQAEPRPRLAKPPHPPGQTRQVGRVLLSVLVIVMGAALGATAYSLLVQRTTFVAASHDIPAGHVLTRDDLTGIEVSGAGVSAVPGSEARSLLGKTTAGPIPKGALIPVGMTADLSPGTGEAAVGVALKPGQMPAELVAGRSVSVLSVQTVPAAGQEELTAPVLVDHARVVSVTTDAAGSWLVTLAVPEASAEPVAAAAAAGRAAVVMLPLGE